MDPDSSQIIQPQWRFAVARAESDFGSGSWSPVGGPQVLLVDHLGYKLLTYRTALQIIYIYIIWFTINVSTIDHTLADYQLS